MPRGFCSGTARIWQRFLPHLEHLRRFSTELQWGVPPAQMGQQIGVGLALVSTGGTLQIEQVLPEFIGKPSDIEIASHPRYCI